MAMIADSLGAVVCTALLAAQSMSAAQVRPAIQGETVSIADLDSRSALSKQQIFADIVALANARRESGSLYQLTATKSGATPVIETQGPTYPGVNKHVPSPDTVSTGDDALTLNAGAARKLALQLESELQKAMTRREIDSAVRTWNQFSSPIAKMKTVADFQDAMKKPSKRPDAIRALANRIERATDEKERADFRSFLLAVEVAPVGSDNLVDFLLQTQSSDALTGACASVVLSQASLSAEQAERMIQALAKQRATTNSDPVIQHLVDFASQYTLNYKR
jgi:hypothetical protein